MNAAVNFLDDGAEGPFTGGDGVARVRLLLDAADRSALRACLRRAAAEMTQPTIAPRFVEAGEALDAHRDGAVVMEPDAYFALCIAVTKARISMILSSEDASTLAEIGERIASVGEADHPADERASSTREDHPMRIGSAQAGELSDAEVAAAGWASRGELERHHPGGRVDAYDLREFNACERLHLNGMCSTLAVAMHDATGWEIVAVRDPWSGVPNHFACRTPEGLFADARGSDLTLRELVAGFGRWAACPPTVAPMSRDQVVRGFRRHPADYATAAAALPRLLPEIFEAPSPATAA